jgi:STAM-binding protein
MMNEHQVSRGYHGSMLYRPSTSSHSGPLNGSDPVARELKKVTFPRDCLNRFLSIASIDTHPYRETCGMLLGEYKGGRYIVTTLLVPKQHVTDGSDSCEMDEEELVVQFVEEHSLFTLGWVRCHPYWLVKASAH